jgi:SAM-dependent methyltransferase
MVDNYSKLADIYEYVMKRVRYDRWSEYLYHLTKDFVKKNPLVLELAAGKCGFTEYFREYYPDIIATDLSFNMLAKSNCRLPKVCCNMLNLPFKRQFDLIYSTFDSINYLTSKEKLFKMLKEVSCILSDEGIFTFDVSMEKNSIQHAEEPVREGKYKGISYIHKSEYLKDKSIHKNTFRFTDENGRNYIEIHKQKIYSFETYFNLIPKAGLYIMDVYKAFSFAKGNKDSERLQFILKKAGGNALID